MLVALYRVVLNTTNKVIIKRVSLSLKMIGRYCPTYAYEDLLVSAIKNELASYYPFTQAGSLKAFGYLFSGAIELIPDSQNLSKVSSFLDKFMKTVKESILDALDIELGQILVLSLNEMLDSLIIKKETQKLDVSEVIDKHLYDCFCFLVKSLAVLQSFKLMGKEDPDNVIATKRQIYATFPKLAKLSVFPSQDFVTENLGKLINETFSFKSSHDLSTVSLQSPTWRMYHALFDGILSADLLQLKLPEPSPKDTINDLKRQQQTKDVKAIKFEDI